jgi:hypothetical protein
MAKPAEFQNVWSQFLKTMDGINLKAYEDHINQYAQTRVKEWAE